MGPTSVPTNVTAATVPKPGVTSSRPAFEETEGKGKKRREERKKQREEDRGSGPRVLRRDKEKVKEREMGWGEKERGHGVTRTSYRFISSENGERLVGKQTENNMSANSYRSQKHVKTSDYLSPTKPKAVLLAGAEP